MVYYKEEKKELIIPSGFIYDGCGGSDCEYEIEQAYQSGWTNGYNSGITTDCGEAIEEAYQSGYTAGLEDCPECSGGTCNLETRNISLNNSFDGDETITPTQGYDGFDSVRIIDNGYGQSKYDEGYQAGLEDCSGSTPCDCSSAITEAYQSGYTAGLADCPECSGSSCNLQIKSVVVTANTQSVTPDQGYDGLNFVGISAGSFGDARYDDGYQSGYTKATEVERSYLSGITITQNGVYTKLLGGYNRVIVNVPSGGSSCNLVQGQFELYVGWPGSETINPPATADGFSSFTIVDNGWGSQLYEAGFDDGFSSGRTYGRREGYYQGEQSVIQSFLTGNSVTNYGAIDDYGYVVAYYYTPSNQMCVITGYDRDCDERWDDAFSNMSVDGGPWEAPQLYYYLTEGWHQIRFNVKDKYLHYAFNHNFPTEYVEDPFGNEVIPYMDALKAVSLPEANSNQSGVTAITGTFKMNNGIRILSSSMKSFGVNTGYTANGNALSGATNLNMIISHYQGNENVDITSEIQNGILFYPAGKSSTHSSTLSGWTHMELF